MPTNKKSSPPPPSSKKPKDSTLSDAQASRVKGGRITRGGGGTGGNDTLIP